MGKEELPRDGLHRPDSEETAKEEAEPKEENEDNPPSELTYAGHIHDPSFLRSQLTGHAALERVSLSWALSGQCSAQSAS